MIQGAGTEFISNTLVLREVVIRGYTKHKNAYTSTETLGLYVTATVFLTLASLYQAPSQCKRAKRGEPGKS